MFDARGLVAVVLTVNPTMLALAAVVGALLAAGFYLFASWRAPNRRAFSVGLSLLTFLGATGVVHVVLSSLSGLSPLGIEVVKLGS